jgi:hypothetical protein
MNAPSTQYYSAMPRLGLGIHEYQARSQLFSGRLVGETTPSASKLVDGKAKPCHDGMVSVSTTILVP